LPVLFPATRAVCFAFFAKISASFAVKTENRKGRKVRRGVRKERISGSNWSCTQSHQGGLLPVWGKPPVLFGLALSFTSPNPSFKLESLLH